MKKTLFAAALFPLCACATLGPGASRALDVREAAFRRAFLEQARGEPRPGPRYCLSVQGEDAGEDLLARLRDAAPAVVKASACKDRPMAERTGVVFVQVGEIERVSRTEVRVPVSVSERPMTGTGYLYRLKRENGRWNVIRIETVWVS